MRADRGVHLHRHLGPCLAGQRDQPVDSRGLAARIALRDLAHATRTLNQLRSISCCRSLTPARSPSLTALKILRRSRRTSSSQRRQSTRSQASPSKTGRAGRRSSGPFTEVSNLPFGSSICFRFASKAHLPTSAPLQARASARIRPVMQGPSGGDPGAATPVLLGSDRGALPRLLSVGFPGPPAAPGVRLSPHRALQVSWPLVSRWCRLSVSWSMGSVCFCRGSGSGSPRRWTRR